MNINHIELSPGTIAELYENTLTGTIDKENNTAMETRLKETKNEPGKSDEIKALGNNRKHILILVKNQQAVFLLDEELNFLAEILLACRLSLDDVKLVNVHAHTGIIYKPLLEQFKSRIILLFDVEPGLIGLPVSFPHYQLQAFSGCTFLYSPSLKRLENDKVEKSKLWVCLKRLFNL